MNKERALEWVRHELARAGDMFPPFRSIHEGLAVIREEYLELEAEVFKKQEDREMIELRKEARHLAAMALRFLVDCCPYPEDKL